MTGDMWKLPEKPGGGNLRLHADKSCIHIAKASEAPVRVDPDEFDDWLHCDYCSTRAPTAQRLRHADPEEVLADD